MVRAPSPTLPHMLASNLPVRPSTPPRCLAPRPPQQHPQQRRLSERPRFDRDRGSKLVGRLRLGCRRLAASVDWGKVDLVARMGAGCFKVARESDRGVRVEFDSGGQDFFDAVAVETGGGIGATEHLVIMVNGMVGRYG